MRNRPIHKTYEWTLKSSPEALWPYLSDSARLNEALGQPRYTIFETFDANGIRRRYAETIEDETRIRWEEPPFEWVTGAWWRWRRFHEDGPFQETGAILMLSPLKGGGTTVRYTLTAAPRGIMGKMLTASGHLKLAGVGFEKLTKRIDSFCQNPKGEFFSNLAAEKAKAKPVDLPKPATPDGEILNQFAHWLSVAPHTDRQNLRSKRLARCLGISEAEALRACLLAVRSGDLTMRYDAICSACRASANEYSSLRDIPALMACGRCGGGYHRNMDDGVEVLFRVAKADDGSGAPCCSGPSVARHVRIQQSLGAKERREMLQGLPAGSYIARAVDGPASEPFVFSKAQGFRVVVTDGDIAVSTLEKGGVIENHAKRGYAITLEHTGLPPDTLSVPELLSAQAFRTLMPDERLADGDTASLGEGVIMAVADLGHSIDERAATAVIEDEDGCRSLVFATIDAAKETGEAMLKAHPEARFAMDYGALSITSLGGQIVYTGTVPETAQRLARAGYRGKIVLSGAMREALSDRNLSLQGAAQ